MGTRTVIAAASVLALVALCGCGGGGGDNKGILSFTSLSYSVNENGTPLNQITIQRLGGDGEVGATVIVEPGTASANQDYAVVTIPVSWAAGDQSPKIITIPILEDHDDEPDETLTLRLVNPTGGATIRDPLGDTTLHIVDDDVAGTIQFALQSYIFLEDGTPFGPEVVVTRSGGSDGVVTATVTMTDGTATGDPNSPVEPYDFTPTTITVTFLDQDTTPVQLSLSGVIRQDLLPEPAELFHLELVNPTGGALIGFTSPAEVTIADDDMVLAIPNPAPGSLFGAAVAKVGSKLLVGAPGNAGQEGRVYVFDPADGTLVDTIVRTGSSQFGSVLSSGGTTVAVGTPGSVWALDASTFADRFVLTSSAPGFGSAAIVTADGRLVVGAPQSPPMGGGATLAGAAFVYEELTGAPLPTIFGTGDRQLGAAFAALGTDLIVGAPGAPGAVYQYSGDPYALTITVDEPSPQTPPAAFGRALATSALEFLVFIGAPDADVSGQVDAGRVDLVAPSGNLTASPAIAGDRFGAHLLVSGDFVYIQAANGGPSTAGRVYVYDKFLSEVLPIDSPNPTAGGNFGGALGDFDGSVVIGAPGETGGGAVYIVKLF